MQNRTNPERAMRVWLRLVRLEARMQAAVSDRLRMVGVSIPALSESRATTSSPVVAEANCPSCMASWVWLAAERGVALEKLSLADLQSVEPRITEGAFGVLGVERSVRSRTSYSGTAPANVRRQAKAWLKRLGG